MLYILELRGWYVWAYLNTSKVSIFKETGSILYKDQHFDKSTYNVQSDWSYETIWLTALVHDSNQSLSKDCVVTWFVLWPEC